MQDVFLFFVYINIDLAEIIFLYTLQIHHTDTWPALKPTGTVLISWEKERLSINILSC